MILLVAASLYFPLRDLNDAMARGPVSGERALLADPPQAQPGAELQEAAPDLAEAPEAGADDAGQSQRVAGAVPETVPPKAPGLRQVVDTAPEGVDPLPSRTEDLTVASQAPVEPEPVAQPPAEPELTARTPAPVTGAPGAVPPVLRQPVSGPDAGPVALPSPPAAQPQVEAAAPEAVASAGPASAEDLRVPALRAAGPDTALPASIGDAPQDGVAPLAPEAPPRAAPQIGPAPETPRLATQAEAAPALRLAQSGPPRPDLAPADLPLPPVAPNAIAAPGPPPDSAPPMPEPAAEPPAATPATLPRRLVLDGAERFAMAGPGISGRMPRIGDPLPSLPPESATPRAEDAAPVGALTRNAQQFASPENASLLSIVVEAPRTGALDTEALAASRLPLSIAVDPTLPEAPDLTAELRGAGHDVLITLTGLPSAPEPRDIDVALGAHIARLPEAVGIWLPADSPVLQDRLLLRHLSEVLAETGHGLLAPGDGLDAAVQEARRAGVPAAASFAEVTLQDPLVLRRNLDRIALRARSGEGGVVQATLTPEILTTLRGWSAGLPQADVAVAPVSAYLQRSAP
ncbi:divergent polysaccharide deacetylase family protein [Dinoroseobacter sp. S76]|uniref:divergent polysaccharide deacetylase family protein n=1 Tax=Dinoroseobacter sp. S76 TaxID=3415124 RepID=UPI003C7C376E